MIITYEGAEFIKITHGDLTVAINPISKNSKLKSSSFGADLCLITVNHPDMNGADTVARGDKQPFVINGPGEYEFREMFIEGFLSKTNYDGKERINTIYALEIDKMQIAFLGAHGEPDVSNEVKEELGDIDILFVPIGGEGVLDSQEAYKLAVKREPKVIIPIHFGSIGEKDALKRFLEEGGAEDTTAVEKLTVKSKDLIGKKGEIVVLKSSN
ncbi:MAG: MBL fold metallo-hydrolase [Candidatus Pacebacteria bacterium]|nr:MBL fold metallo-hydrolase [Candidatus Paceibacterota bacterium]